MNNSIDFNALVEMAITTSERKFLKPIIEKEILHYDILFALKEAGLLEIITFQGGTSLRLCYGGTRFSEDLDFAGGKNFNSQQMNNLKSCIEDFLTKRYGLSVEVLEPKSYFQKDTYKMNIHKWQIKIITSPKRKDLPKQMIKIEVANVDAYSAIPQFINFNYEFLPESYKDIIIRVESLEEIMADKIIAFSNTRQYIRYRDIWDLHWISQHGTLLNHDFIRAKVRDYHVENFREKVSGVINDLPNIISSDVFKNEMRRFLTEDVLLRTLKNPLFSEALRNQLITLFTQVYNLTD